MKFKENTNYAIISNNINQELINIVKDFIVINSDIDYEELINRVNTCNMKTICFNDVLRQFSSNDKKYIFDLLKLRNMDLINITSNIEEVLESDYLLVFKDNNLIMEGKVLEVLKEEKILKRIGFSLPFALDLSKQLVYYEILNDVESDLKGLVDKLWT